MKVALRDPEIRLTGAETAVELAPDSIGQTSEWIDPEGDDWFAAIYQELIRGAAPTISTERPIPELEHWFG
jgi:hypothetical protein